MKSILKCLILMFLFCVTIDCKPSSSVTYDERQTGDYNIRISVKDLKIVALLGEGIGALGDYDYNYDYSDLTVKPNESTTSSTTTTTQKEPLISNLETTTEKVVEITPAHVPIVHINKPNTTIYQKPNVTLNQKFNSTVYQKPGTATTNQKPDSTIFQIPTTSNFIGESVIAALQSPTIQTPIKNVLANFSTLFTEFVESGSLGFKNNSNMTLNAKPSNDSIPVQVLVTPVEIHYHHDESSTTSKPENSTVKRVRHGDCMEGYRKDKRGVCRPFHRRPTQPSLLKKLLQLSHRLQNNKHDSAKNRVAQ